MPSDEAFFEPHEIILTVELVGDFRKSTLDVSGIPKGMQEQMLTAFGGDINRIANKFTKIVKEHRTPRVNEPLKDEADACNDEYRQTRCK